MTDTVYPDAIHHQIINAVVAEFPLGHQAQIFEFLNDRRPWGAQLDWLGHFLMERIDNLAVHGSTIEQAEACFDGVALPTDGAVLQIIADRAESMSGYGVAAEGKVHDLLTHLLSIVAKELQLVRHQLEP